MANSRVAVLGTLAEFHKEPIPFDMQALVDLVVEIAPDLLCIDISPQRWEQQDFADLSPEYREGLLPLAEQSDVVVVPIGRTDGPSAPAAHGWRGRLITVLREALSVIQRSAPSPDAINHGWRHDLANLYYFLIETLSDRKIEHHRGQHTKELIASINDLASRDPGSRILVVVNVQYCHRIRPVLRHESNIDVVKFREL